MAHGEAQTRSAITCWSKCGSQATAAWQPLPRWLYQTPATLAQGRRFSSAQGSAPPSIIASISLSLMVRRGGPGGPLGTGMPRRTGIEPPTMGTAIM